MRKKGESLFWMEFRSWVKNRIEAGDIRAFTLKRLFLYFKNDFLPWYVRNKNGVHHAYMDIITFDDIQMSLLAVVVQLQKDKVIVKVGRRKWRANGHDRTQKIEEKPLFESEKIPIREVDENAAE